MASLSRQEALAKIEEMQKGRVSVAGLSFHGVSLAGLDLGGLDFSGADLSAVDLTKANLEEARFFKTNLAKASLFQANLGRCDFTGARLTQANLEEAKCGEAGFGMADLSGARLFGADLSGATLTKSHLDRVDMRCAVLHNARLRETVIRGADLTGADLRGADLSLCDVAGSVFNNADMRDSRLRLVRNFESAEWLGSDIRDINFAGAYSLRRFIIDQNYLREFRDRSRLNRFIYQFWWLTSDCGRSLLRWCLFIAFLAVFFAWLYSFVDVKFGGDASWVARIYFSVVTLTTLGFGDIVPISPLARIITLCEVITGYLMLGGLLSIFNNMIARRGE